MSVLRRVFLGANGVRAGWRMLAFWIGGFGFTIAAALVMMPILALFGDAPWIESEAIQVLLTAPVVLVFPVWSVVCGLVFREGARGSGLGGPFLRSLGEWIAGTTIGAALIMGGVGLIALSGYAVDGVSVTMGMVDEPQWMMLLAWIPALMLMSLWEEALFRGYGLMWTGRALGNGLTWVLPQDSAKGRRAVHALAKLPILFVSCLMFALLHLGNPSNSGWLPTLNTALAGLWLAIPLYRSRALWWSWGLHFGWNACMGLGLGIEVSGVEMGRVMKTVLEGPDWISGGGYGLEGSVAGTVMLVIGLGIGLLSPRRKDAEAADALVLERRS